MKYKTIVLAAFAAVYIAPLISYGAISTNKCVELFTHESPLPVDSVEWKRVSVRDPREQIISSEFLTRLHDSLYQVFEPWFLGDVPTETFKDMLQKQHIVATTDPNGKAYYAGASFESDELVEPGAYVFESKVLYGKEVDPNTYRLGLVPVEYREHLSPEMSKKLAAQLRKMSKEEHNSERVFRYPIKLPRLGYSVLVGCEAYMDYKEIVHGWPVLKDVPKVLGVMSEILVEIKKIPPGEDNQAVISKLTEYIYLGATAGHPFRRANFSLFMSHVNWILRHHGLNGISHGSLDYISMFFQYDVFQQEFLKEIREANPGV